MRGTNLKKIGLIAVLAGAALLLVQATLPKANIEQLSLDMSVRTLFQGKSIHGTGEVYYRIKGGSMVTKMNYPVEQLIFTNALGEYKSYDMRSNAVMLSQGINFSSKNSFIYSFLSGETNDMGLSRLQYSLEDTRFEDDLVIKTWKASDDLVSKARKVEVAYNDFLPIFVGFYRNDGSVLQKTYYTNYQDVSYMKMPLTITEIEYLNDVDSTITQRKYSNLKVNTQVNEQWLNFTIPSDAKVVTEEDFMKNE